jgi:hypothetical protein
MEHQWVPFEVIASGQVGLQERQNILLPDLLQTG